MKYAIILLFCSTNAFAQDAATLQSKINALNSMVEQYNLKISSWTIEKSTTQYELDKITNKEAMKQKILQEIALEQEIIKQKQAELDALNK